MTYRTFSRTWWRMENGKRVPGAGRKTHLGTFDDKGAARNFCRAWNINHDPGPLSRKAEYEKA